MAARVPGMPMPRATLSLVSRPPLLLLLLVGPEVDVDVLEAPCAAEEVEVSASEDDGDKESEDDNDVKEDIFAPVAVAVVPAATVLADIVPAVVASPRLQYAAKTDAAFVASGWGGMEQKFKMFVDIWSENSWLAASAPQKQ